MSKEEIKAYQEKILDDLLSVFDERIENEKGERSEQIILGDALLVKYCNGRVDGVDTGRALVERYFASLEATDE
ncbi:hypothetical protein ACP6H4_02025 [Vibrio harveyi]|uniref:hypothetical protein n=1 Tax=Vibrio harveyi TaxID=669 RepID=UPI00334B76E1